MSSAAPASLPLGGAPHEMRRSVCRVLADPQRQAERGRVADEGKGAKPSRPTQGKAP